MRIVSGHQPVYLPWLGLFHKISLCDDFVWMDDVQYLSQDWNNRNYVRGPHGRIRLTVPVSLRLSRSRTLHDVRIDSSDWGQKNDWQQVHWQSLSSAYRRTPYWQTHGPFFESVYCKQSWDWLCELNEHIMHYLLDALGLKPNFVRASKADFEGAKSDLVLDHCRKRDASICVLGMHGRSYIQESDFFAEGCSLYYQSYRHPEYNQRFEGFVPNLSIVDLLFNHGPKSLHVLTDSNVTKTEILDIATRQDRPTCLNDAMTGYTHAAE